MSRPVSTETVLKRFQVQVKEIEALRQKSVTGKFPDSVYTDYVTCQGTQPARENGKDHKKCGKRVSMANAYKCLYCQFWFCTSCAEKHFGKTREQHNKEMAEEAKKEMSLEPAEGFSVYGEGGDYIDYTKGPWL